MVSKLIKPSRKHAALLIIAVMFSLCSSILVQSNADVLSDDSIDRKPSICDTFKPIEEIGSAKTEEKKEIIVGHGLAASRRQGLSKHTSLICFIAMSLYFASICIAILHAKMKAESGTLYIIRFIHLSDGMK